MPIGRPITLPEPLRSLAEKAGGVGKLRDLMGGIPSTTINRWGALLAARQPLPRSATQAIEKAQAALSQEKA